MGNLKHCALSNVRSEFVVTQTRSAATAKSSFTDSTALRASISCVVLYGQHRVIRLSLRPGVACRGDEMKISCVKSGVAAACFLAGVVGMAGSASAFDFHDPGDAGDDGVRSAQAGSFTDQDGGRERGNGNQTGSGTMGNGVNDGGATVAVVAEPGTYAMIGVGLTLIGFVARRRRKEDMF